MSSPARSEREVPFDAEKIETEQHWMQLSSMTFRVRHSRTLPLCPSSPTQPYGCLPRCVCGKAAALLEFVSVTRVVIFSLLQSELIHISGLMLAMGATWFRVRPPDTRHPPPSTRPGLTRCRSTSGWAGWLSSVVSTSLPRRERALIPRCSLALSSPSLPFSTVTPRSTAEVTHILYNQSQRVNFCTQYTFSHSTMDRRSMPVAPK